MLPTLLLTLVFAGPSQAAMLADDPLVPPRSLRSLERAAEELANKGRRLEMRELQETLVLLGQADEEREKLQKACDKALAKAKRREDKVPRAVSELGRGMKALTKELESLEGVRRQRLAQLLLSLDDSLASAHGILGHVEHEGRFVDPEFPAFLQRRREIQEAVRAVQHMDFDLTFEVSEHPLVMAVQDRPGTRARFRSLVFDSPIAEPRLARILTNALRGRVLSHYLRTGELSLPEGMGRAPRNFVTLLTREHYEKAIEAAVKLGELPAEQATQAKGWAAFFGKSAYVHFEHSELHLYAVLTFLLGEGQFSGHDIQPVLLVGHVNWICMTLFGVGMPGVGYTEYEDGPGGGPDGGTASTSMDHAEARERKAFLRMASAGVTGARSWLTWLVRRGEDPQWAACMLDEVGKIGGRLRLKATFLAEYLQERGPLQELITATGRGRAGERPPAEVFEDALGMTQAELEERWRRWLLPSTGGLLQRLGGGPEAEPFSKEQTRTLAYLEELRKQAWSWAPEDYVPVVLDAQLSAGCAAHGRYLRKHPQQAAAWPDAHEEYPDQEGFSAIGAWAGMHSVIAPGVSDGREAVDAWMGTFFHRLPLLEPGLIRMGYGADGGNAVMDCGSIVDKYAVQGQIRWPPEDARGIPLRFAPELPNPVPGEDQGQWGYPITVQAYGSDQDLTLSLHEGRDADGPAVDCWFTSPSAPLNKELAPDSAYCLIPKASLKANTTYTVKVVDGWDGSLETWSFTTGS